MKTKKLLRKIRALLSSDERALAHKHESLDRVLEKLVAKEARLREKLENENDEERCAELRRKIDVVRAQRKKGQKVRAELQPLLDEGEGGSDGGGATARDDKGDDESDDASAAGDVNDER